MPPTFKSSTQAPRKTPIQCTEALPFPTPNPQNPNSPQIERLQTLTQPPNTTQHNTTPAAPNRQPDTSVVRTAGGVAAESEVPAGRSERRARRPRRAPVARAGGEAATARGGRRGEIGETQAAATEKRRGSDAWLRRNL